MTDFLSRSRPSTGSLDSLPFCCWVHCAWLLLQCVPTFHILICTPEQKHAQGRISRVKARCTVRDCSSWRQASATTCVMFSLSSRIWPFAFYYHSCWLLAIWKYLTVNFISCGFPSKLPLCCSRLQVHSQSFLAVHCYWCLFLILLCISCSVFSSKQPQLDPSLF